MHLIMDFGSKFCKYFTAAPHRVRSEHGYLASLVRGLGAHLGACRSSSTHLSAILSIPLNLLHTLFGIPLYSVYCNTLLTNLNVRSYARGDTVMHGVDTDLFGRSRLPVSDSTKSDKQHGEEQVVPFGHMVSFHSPS